MPVYSQFVSYKHYPLMSVCSIGIQPHFPVEGVSFEKEETQAVQAPVESAQVVQFSAQVVQVLDCVLYCVEVQVQVFGVGL